MAANAAPGEGCASSWRRPVVPAPAGVTLAEGNAPPSSAPHVQPYLPFATVPALGRGGVGSSVTNPFQKPTPSLQHRP